MSTINRSISVTANDVAESVVPLDIPLDGSEASLKDLDEAISMIWGEVGPADEDFDGMVWGYGCYVADVIQRHHAGEWKPSEYAGYDFIPGNDVIGFNPWHWVEKRFQSGDLIAQEYKLMTDVLREKGMSEGRVKAATAASAKRTSIQIDGRGISMALLEIDEEGFLLLTQTGINEIEFEELLAEVEDEGHYEEGLHIDGLSVCVDDAVYMCSWDKIKHQMNDQLPKAYKPYEHLNNGEYLVVYEKGFTGTWRENDVEEYRHSKLKFEVGCLEPSKGQAYLLMDFAFSSDAPRYSSTYAEDNDAYVVDRQGSRYEIKRTYEW